MEGLKKKSGGADVQEQHRMGRWEYPQDMLGPPPFYPPILRLVRFPVAGARYPFNSRKSERPGWLIEELD